MKNQGAQDEYTDAGFFVLRTPLLPFEEFLKLSSLAQEEIPGHFAAGSDRTTARAHLRQWVERPEVREALWIASPDLIESLTTWFDDPESAKGRKLEQALYRYLARMTARSTPFGAFAGCSTGEISDTTQLDLGPRAQYRRSTRLDMEYLHNLAQHLSSDPGLRSDLHFRCNTTLHVVSGKYHHVQTGWQNGDPVFQLIATDSTPALDATLSSAASGVTAGALASALVAGDPEIKPEEANAFVGRLIESQLLVSDLMPPVTGKEAILCMAEQLERAQASGLAAELRAVAKQLRGLDSRGLGADLHAYDGIVDAVARLGGEFKPGHLVQVDLVKTAATVSLDRQLVKDVLVAIQALHSIRNDPGQPALQQFKEAFQDRYQDQEVPLLEALDDEAGIGFESEDNPAHEPLLAGIDFRPAEETQNEDKSVPPILARRLEELHEKRETVLALDSELLDELKVANPLPLPDAFTVMGAFFRGPEGQPSYYAHTIFGPSGANLLARFRHADERLAEYVQAHINAEEALQSHSSAVFAEIAHLPEGRVGNVVCRPVLRRYEIPLLATSGVPPDRQIALSDLTVSLRQDRIVLRSRRLGVEVLPRLTSAHNYGSPRSLKLYKFLCLLQHQGRCSDLFWDWGAAGKASFLPRVQLGNVVVSLACWRINKETALDLVNGRTTLQQWRETNLVPRFAFIAEFDHQLLIDFENPLAVETFLEHIRKQSETVMVEMFPVPGNLSVRGPEGSFVHEIILSIIRKQPAAPPAAEVSAPERVVHSAVAPASNLKLEAGSEWLFAKLYCSPSNADRLLLELVKPLVKETLAAGHADRWFFIRYADPNWHLRLRLHGDPVALGTHVLRRLQERCEQHRSLGTLWRWGLDVYEPETERYGGPSAIGIAERLFQLDSQLCVSLVELVSKGQDADLRWQLALSGIDQLLTGLGFNLEEKYAIAKHMAQSCEQAYVVDESYRKQIAARFREERRTLAALCGPTAAGT
ncbi:MAG TPA: lantibiotic dehydratase, partial [Alphaproteobacteria bacterium]|nr:lantibiotic dehydratase [Alphaproteobacteria bacterium]